MYMTQSVSLAKSINRTQTIPNKVLRLKVAYYSFIRVQEVYAISMQI